MQSKEELEVWYDGNDPWGYETNPDDAYRKQRLLSFIPGTYKRALDIGCGEGWITKDLPADEIHGIELSDKAASRFPDNVKQVSQPEGTYDLVVCTGSLYRQYDHQQMIHWINQSASKDIIIAGIKDWLVTLPWKEQKTETFPYREFEQKLTHYVPLTS